jgi:hypothetical protein
MSDKHSIAHWRRLERAHNYLPDMGPYEAAMGFEEIAAVLGTDRQHVYHWYASGIKKLRRNPDMLLRLLGIADALSCERDKRGIVE